MDKICFLILIILLCIAVDIGGSGGNQVQSNFSGSNIFEDWVVVGWCEGVVYLMSPGRPTGIGLQLGKSFYPCSK